MLESHTSLGHNDLEVSEILDVLEWPWLRVAGFRIMKIIERLQPSEYFWNTLLKLLEASKQVVSAR